MEERLEKGTVLSASGRVVNAADRATGGDRPPYRSYGTELCHGRQVPPLGREEVCLAARSHPRVCVSLKQPVVPGAGNDRLEVTHSYAVHARRGKSRLARDGHRTEFGEKSSSVRHGGSAEASSVRVVGVLRVKVGEGIFVCGRQFRFRP